MTPPEVARGRLGDEESRPYSERISLAMELYPLRFGYLGSSRRRSGWGLGAHCFHFPIFLLWFWNKIVGVALQLSHRLVVNGLELGAAKGSVYDPKQLQDFR